MNKSELIKNIGAQYPHLSAHDIKMATRQVFDYLSDALAAGEHIELRGFGSFSMRVRPAKRGRNPKTGEVVLVPEKRIPHFKPGKDLREQVDYPEGVAGGKA